MSHKNSSWADYIVVGAGSAGAVIAARLSENPDAKVLLLEAGGDDNDLRIKMPAAIGILLNSRRHNWNYDTVPQTALAGRQIPMPRGKVLGGSSSINGMVYIRGHPLDYERWVEEGAAGWSYAQVLPYFKKLENHAHRHDIYHGQNGPVKVVTGAGNNPLQRAFLKAGEQAGYRITEDFNGYRQEGFGSYDMNVDSGTRASTAHAYLRKARKRPNLRIIVQADVHRVLFDHGRAVGVEAIVSGKLEKFVAESEVVLSAGAINSPKILMQSGIGEAAELEKLGIGVFNNLPQVGKNLQDHVEMHLQYRCPTPITLYRDTKPLKMALIGARWVVLKDGKAATNHYEVGAFIKSDPGVQHPDIQMHFSPICYDGSYARSVNEEGFRLHVGSMRSQSRGSIRLVSNDPRQAPLIDPQHMSSEADWCEARAAIRMTREVIAQKAFDGLRTDELPASSGLITNSEIDHFIRTTAMTAFHPAGTCRMGSDEDSVVDPECRVRGVERLRVADASIMPSIISGNLNVPTMMIGERAADMILGESLPAETTAKFHGSDERAQALGPS